MCELTAWQGRGTAWARNAVCELAFTGIAGSNPAGGMDVCLLSVVCCQIEVCASGCPLVQRSPTECGVLECDREASILRRPWPTRAVAPWKEHVIHNKCNGFTRYAACSFLV